MFNLHMAILGIGIYGKELATSFPPSETLSGSKFCCILFLAQTLSRVLSAEVMDTFASGASQQIWHQDCQAPKNGMVRITNYPLGPIVRVGPDEVINALFPRL
jgi:hypothetical protein